MAAPTLVQLAADRLANGLRLYSEACHRFPGLVKVDAEEAVGNHDRAFDGILNAMHSLYDAMKAAALPLNFYAHGDTEACLLVRNARHHNTAGLFQSWNSLMMMQGGLRRMAGAQFLLVGFTLVAGEGVVSRYYVPWDDFRILLADPKAQVRDRPGTAARLDAECGFDAIRARVERDRYPPNQVFVNLVPVVMNAATRVFAALDAAGIPPAGYDAGVYAKHFRAAPLADLTKPTFDSLRAPAVH